MPVHMRTAAWWIFRARFAADLTVSLSLGPRAAGFPGSRTLHFQAEAHRYAERSPAETTRVTATGLSSLRTGLGASTLSFCKRITTSSTTMSDSMAQRLVWVDLEMTGLDIEKDQIIEMACIITDSNLNILAEGPNLIIKQPDELLDGMSDWCTEHHGKSGLTQAVRDSKISLQQAEYEFLAFVRDHSPPGSLSPGRKLCAR
ncbi:hypothetical protein SKAU_G00323930 [Synaphobranchus kaupii]|uniref:Exonuclease domain-containing protein n=1 Tax=Synaphobranchus kaupii TaxID=118154 RepID=A0A9Q1IJ39_SYNKA|nr:hypothetical protein SKAU_G00323930 [Synaphobranchus kaupii]